MHIENTKYTTFIYIHFVTAYMHYTTYLISCTYVYTCRGKYIRVLPSYAQVCLQKGDIILIQEKASNRMITTAIQNLQCKPSNCGSLAQMLLEILGAERFAISVSSTKALEALSEAVCKFGTSPMLFVRLHSQVYMWWQKRALRHSHAMGCSLTLTTHKCRNTPWGTLACAIDTCSFIAVVQITTHAGCYSTTTLTRSCWVSRVLWISCASNADLCIRLKCMLCGTTLQNSTPGCIASYATWNTANR
jgi:hypothetical protein